MRQFLTYTLTVLLAALFSFVSIEVEPGCHNETDCATPCTVCVNSCHDIKVLNLCDTECDLVNHYAVADFIEPATTLRIKPLSRIFRPPIFA